jgi:ADP-L-glycero-D-manno-heptose 6-epimerase
MQHRKDSGLYNLGTGTARTWNDLSAAIFKGLDLPVQIKYRPIPEDIRDTYQYFTEATMEKLRSIGYNKPFTTIEDGVGEYVRDYLNKQVYY